VLWMAVMAVAYRWFTRNTLQVRTATLFREQLGEGPVPVVMELRPQGLWVRQRSTELSFDWSDAVSVSEIPEGVEFVFGGGTAIARRRAFTDPSEHHAFAQRASELMKAATAPS